MSDPGSHIDSMRYNRLGRKCTYNIIAEISKREMIFGDGSAFLAAFLLCDAPFLLERENH